MKNAMIAMMIMIVTNVITMTMMITERKETRREEVGLSCYI